MIDFWILIGGSLMLSMLGGIIVELAREAIDNKKRRECTFGTSFLISLGIIFIATASINGVNPMSVCINCGCGETTPTTPITVFECYDDAGNLTWSQPIADGWDYQTDGNYAYVYNGNSKHICSTAWKINKDGKKCPDIHYLQDGGVYDSCEQGR